MTEKKRGNTEREKRVAAKKLADRLGLTMAELATHLGVSKQALYARLRSPSMDVKTALTPGAFAINPRFEGQNTIRKACVDAGVPENTYWQRRKSGSTHEAALGR